MNDPRQGIVHVMGPEQGATLPGMTVVCGDSHTSTHGAFGALAHGIGTSEVEHVLATQCLVAKKMKNMRVRVDGQLGRGVTAKDVVLAITPRSAPPVARVMRSSSPAVPSKALSIEGRMTVCNMAIEAGARPAWWQWIKKPSITLKASLCTSGRGVGSGSRILEDIEI